MSHVRLSSARRSTPRPQLPLALMLALAVMLALVVAPFTPQTAAAANPPPVQIYYVPFPDDYLMQHMEDIDQNNTNPNTATGIGDPYPPLRDIIAITVSETGSYVYYDQWEHATGGGQGYDADIANPTNVWSSANPGGTQIWGDSNLANGCAPAINNEANPCAVANDDQLTAGDVITLDNLTPLTVGSGDFHGTWIGTRNASVIRFDGKDKIGASAPVAATRAGWSVGNHLNGTDVINATFSLFGDAAAMDSTDQWGTSFVTPVGRDTPMGSGPYPFGYTHVQVMAREAGTFVFADLDQDGVQDTGETATIGEGQIFDPSPNPNPCDTATSDRCGLLEGTNITASKPVQVLLVTGAPFSTWASRWYNLLPRPRWTNDYLTAAGTNPTTGAGCTAVWAYNPGATMNVSQQTTGGTSTTSVAAGVSAKLPNIGQGTGGRLTAPTVFYPVSVTDCEPNTSTGQLYDWGYPPVPTADLTDQVWAGWAPGCSNESDAGICVNTNTFSGNTDSRNPLFVTPLSATTVYVDTNATGITCPGGAGAETTLSGLAALSSSRVFADPTSRASSYDDFSTGAYSGNPANHDTEVTWKQNWVTDWTETGDLTTTPIYSTGAIQIASGALRLGSTSGSGISIQRTANTNAGAYTYARLSFNLSATSIAAGERFAVEISKDNGATWVAQETFDGPWTGTFAQIYNIANLNTANDLQIRFRILSNYASGHYWNIDRVNLDWANNDWDMTGAYLRTCDGTKLAVVYGEDPQQSGSGDNEAPDLGTMIPPFRPATVKTGAIGNYVWVDEDGDGQQDAGGPGIANAKVTLTGTSTDGTVYSLTTYTDSNGGYLFTNLKPSNASGYTVTVDTASLPSGLAANPTYDEDGTGTANTTKVALAAGEEHLTADFGYNWAPTTDVTGTTNTGAIGDRVWIDADGDGKQDLGEAGLGGVTVQLWYDSNNDGTIDAQYGASVTTDAAGNYIFDGLPKGIYEVRITAGTGGYTQTGDPDETLDAKTTTPIVLAPGDVYLNADFGYKSSGTTGTIGDTVWVDANRNNTKDGTGAAAEKGIPGVSVALIRDTNANGIWDTGELIVATDITDENGLYLFEGLPIASYLVWLSDTSNVPPPLTLVWDNDTTGPASGLKSGLGISAVTLTSGAPSNTNQDFAYAPSGHDSGEGLIGDTIFLDRDADGLFDAGEGIEGVTVQLLDSSGRLVGSTTTNENGQYFFGGLAAGTYTVQVIPTTLPGNGVGLTNTVDPDTANPGNNQSSVTLAAGGINLNQDFGYRPVSPQSSNGLSGTVWQDTNADGTLSGETGRFAGVTVDLYFDTNGNGVLDGSDNLVGTTATDSNGDYSFSNLPNGTYLVDVTDTGNVLNGYWKSTGPNAGVDNNSQVDPYKVTLSGGTPNATADFGYYVQPAALGDKVWNDANGNGIQDSGEAAIANAAVTLTITWPGGATTTVKTTTDSNGNYAFKNLLLDENLAVATGSGRPSFVVTFTTPSGYVFTTQDVGSDNAADSDANATTGATTAIYLTAGQTDNTWDAGMYQPASLGDKVWVDANSNGVQDSGEAGLDGVTVRLYKAGGTTALATTATAGGGLYSFANLTPGDYFVEFVTPSGYVFSPLDQGGNDATDSDANTTTGRTATVTLTAGQNNTTVDAGMYQPVSIGDFVWLDANGNGIQDAGETTGVAGATVTLYTAAGTQVGTPQTTTSTGAYSFTALPPGSYKVCFTNPSGYVFSPTGQGTAATDSDAGVTAGGCSANFTLTSGQSNQTIDAGLYQPASLGDRVWVDTNANGVQDSGEAGLDGVTVRLYKVGGTTALATTTTAGGGLYSFANLAPGDYFVEFVTPSGYVFSPLDQGGNDATDSDANTTTGRTATVTLTSGQNNTTVDAGMYQYASLGDKVWVDANSNGVQDSGEAGLDAVTVNVRKASDNTLAGATTTNASGAWSVGNLAPGDYYVEFVAPSGYVFSPKDAGGDDTKDSDADPTTGKTITTTLTSGEIDNTWDAGLYRPATIGDRVWVDANGNGIQDGGELGLGGVTVNVYRAGDNALAGSTATDGSGNWSVGGLPAGDYYVEFVRPTGYTFSPANQGGNDAVDSDADPITGKTATTTLTAGETDGTWDAGLYQQAGISGQVREDMDADGNLTDPDSGIPGVTIQLYTDPNGDGDPSDGVLVDTKQTDPSGFYAFTNVPPGNYVVVQTDLPGYISSGDTSAPNDNRIPVTLPSGGSSTGNDFLDFRPAILGDKVWIDANANGIQDAGEVGLDGVTVELHKVGVSGVLATAVTSGGGVYSFANLVPGDYYVDFTLPSGYQFSPADQGADNGLDSDAAPATGETAQFALVSGQTDNTWDAGMYQPATLGDKAWIDANGNGIQDSGEVGLKDVVVNVYKVGDPTPVGTDTTDANGDWSVSGLVPGDYYVVFTPPTGYYITLPNVGSDDLVDSDPDPANGKTANTTVTSGEVDNSFDAGLMRPDYTVTKTRVSEYSSRPGRRVEFKIRIENTGSMPITFLPLQDAYETAYLTYGYNAEFSAPPTVNNTDDGILNWTNLTAATPLLPGQHTDVTLVFTAKEDTTPNTGGVTTNTATVTGAQFDPDGSGPLPPITFPTKQGSDVVEILRPTSVSVSSFTVRSGFGRVRLVWETADESEVLGFNLLRKAAQGGFEQVNAELILATHAGLAKGAMYARPDYGLMPGIYTYRLEAVALDGARQIVGEVSVSVGVSRK